MGRCYDISSMELDRMCNDIIRRLIESKEPIPPKVKKHAVAIRFKVGENCFSFPNYGWFAHLPEFKNVGEAERFLSRIPDMMKIGDNFWVEGYEKRTYKTSNDERIQYHYEIHEYDYEEFEDGEYHTEYTEEEIEKLKETLVIINKARTYMRAYDYAEDDSVFGNGQYVRLLDEKFKYYEEIDFDNIERFLIE